MSSSEAPQPTPKRLYRSKSDRMIAGVCGGIGDYLNVDPTFVRLAFVLLVLANGVGILLYIIGAFIIPLNPSTTPIRGPPITLPSNLFEMALLAVGVILVIFGSLFLLSGFIAWSPWFLFEFAGRVMWPLALIVVGILILAVGLGARGKSGRKTE